MRKSSATNGSRWCHVAKCQQPHGHCCRQCRRRRRRYQYSRSFPHRINRHAARTYSNVKFSWMKTLDALQPKVGAPNRHWGNRTALLSNNNNDRAQRKAISVSLQRRQLGVVPTSKSTYETAVNKNNVVNVISGNNCNSNSNNSNW